MAAAAGTKADAVVYYTTVLSIALSVATALLLVAAILVFVRMETDGSYWSGRKIVTFWSSAALAVLCLIVAIAAPVTSMVEARKTERGLGDGPRFETGLIDGRVVDGITEMADNFPNVATKCVWDGWRAFVTSNGDHLFVVRDESCVYEATGPS